MAILITIVAGIDSAVGGFAPRPRMWCAIIPALIPLLTPAVIFSRDIEPKAS
jgi:hypothetical protein